MKVLFLCTANKNRSKTAEILFNDISEHDVKSAGLSAKYCEKEGGTLCTEDMLQEADLIYVFEHKHIVRIKEHTGDVYLSKITNLGIDDVYQVMDDCLIRLLKQKCSRLIG
ncbi:MAG: phosphotyrosine protein phosphatase [Alteromonadaceae bacterium]|nr:phosphotyrosine protein phosphatase [Alteromonadaceae bacterium]